MRIGRKMGFALGGAAALTAAAAAIAAETITYKYDVHGRLTRSQRVKEVNGSVVSNVVSDYGYDKADNLTNKAVSGAQ